MTRLRTPLCDRLETRLPIIQAPMPSASTPDLVAAAAQRGAQEAVAGYYKELGLPPPEPDGQPYAPDLESQLRAVEQMRPAVFTFHLGDLPPERVRRLQSLGVRVGGSANCFAEARNLEARGVDFIIAQGAEAGGHRRPVCRAGRAACPRASGRGAGAGARSRSARGARPACRPAPLKIACARYPKNSPRTRP